MRKLIATCDFVNSNVGNIKAGQVLDDCPQLNDLEVNGYVKEYKTKVVQQAPKKPRKRTRKSSKK